MPKSFNSAFIPEAYWKFLDLQEIVGQPAMYSIGLFLALVITFFGRRIFKPLLFFTCAAVVSRFTWQILDHSETKSNLSLHHQNILIISSFAGILSAAVALFLLNFAVFVAGAIVGILVVVSQSSDPEDINWMLLGVVPFVLGLLSSFRFNGFLIMSTSWIGSYYFVYFTDHFYNSDFKAVLENLLAQPLSENIKMLVKSGTIQLKSMVLLWVVLGIAGVLFQYAQLFEWFKKKSEKEKKD